MVTVEKPFSWNRPLDVRWPQHTRHRTRLPWLSACCAVAEGADVQPGAVGAVAAVLRDCQRRVAVCGGREGMPRSLASVYAATIALFQSELRRVRGFVADTGPQQQARGYGVSTADNFAVSRDGTTLFLCRVPFDNVFVFDVASGALRHTLPFGRECFALFVCVSDDDDGLVFVFEWDHFTVLAPETLAPGPVTVFRPLVFHEMSVACVNRSVIAIASPEHPNGAHLYSRDGFEPLGTLGGATCSDVRSVCFLNAGRDLALCDMGKHRVAVFAIARRVMLRMFRLDGFEMPRNIAATLDNEIVCINAHGECVVFGDRGGGALTIPPPPRSEHRLWGVQRLGASDGLVVSAHCSSFFNVVT
jgi:hypothetical protein